MRRFLSRSAWVAYLTMCLSMLVISPASAYIDAGSGSLIFQAVVGGLLAASLAVKVFWGRIITFFRRRK